MNLKTLQEWNLLGFLVKKGSKAQAYNKDGKALFDVTQTHTSDNYNILNDECSDYWQEQIFGNC